MVKKKTAHESGFCCFFLWQTARRTKNASLRHLQPICLKYSGSSCCSVFKTRKSRKAANHLPHRTPNSWTVRRLQHAMKRRVFERAVKLGKPNGRGLFNSSGWLSRRTDHRQRPPRSARAVFPSHSGAGACHGLGCRGAVGSIAGQIAKSKGCRVVGIVERGNAVA